VRKPTRLQTPRKPASRPGAARLPGPRHLLRLAAILLTSGSLLVAGLVLPATVPLAQMTLAQKVSILHGNGNASPYIGNVTGIPSLCIPNLGLQDGPAGVGDGLGGVTQMPSGNASVAAITFIWTVS
jgi:hypothetical protein